MPFETLVFRDGALHLLDQRKLPAVQEMIPIETAVGCAVAIREMVVRGAPAIGCAAAYGLYLGARAALLEIDPVEQEKAFDKARRELRNSRPTAVNLSWALDRMSAIYDSLVRNGASPTVLLARLLAEADAITAEDLAACKAIGRNGADLVPDGKGILTHCNAGGLATAGYGTALGVIRAALGAGKQCDVFADETRPWLQGARLTAWELLQDGIPVTLLPDVAAPSLIASGKIGCVIVGADRIAANGDTANKVGTYGLALAARAHGVPLYVAAPISTLDLNCPDGSKIPIEQRSAKEVTHVGPTRTAAEGVTVFNPAFDVTPGPLVAAIITERGVARPPYKESLRALAPASLKGNP
jgi:methylthioribose-1-phosphate isomerase